MNEIDFYKENTGAFHGRQHLVSHVDMILGLGNNQYSKGTAGRDLLIMSPDGEDISITDVGTLSEERLLKARSWILKESLFAIEWQQIIPMCGEKYILPEDIKRVEDADEILNACIDIWTGEAEDLQKFAETTSVIALFRCWNPVVADRIVVRRRPTQDEIENLPIAINNRRVMATRYPSDNAWKVFAERICKNDYVKKFLYDVQEKKCALCGKNLDNCVVIHHVDYNHKCAFYNSGLDWKISGTRVQPNCERCHSEHAEWFNSCMSRLKAVHNGCHYLIERIL